MTASRTVLRGPAVAARGRLGQRRWVPTLAGLLAAAIGIVDIADAVTPALHNRLRWLTAYVPGGLTQTAAAATVVTGILLLLFAHGLKRRKRRAWAAVVVLLAVSVVLHVLKGLDIEEALVAVAMLAALGYLRAEFYATGDPRTRWRGLGAFLLLTVVSIGVGLVLVRMRLSDVDGPHPLTAQLQQVLYGLVGVTGPLTFDNGRVSDLVAKVLFGLGLVTVLTSAYLLLRPAEPAARLLPEDERRMRELLARHGHRDSLGYFSLRRDKSVIWSPTDKACVAYRVVSGVMLASGDPLGDPEAWPGAITEFLAEADRHAWTPAVMGCSEQAGEAWARHGLDALELGDEAVVEVAEFSLEGRAMRNVRQMVARVERAGYRARTSRVRDLPAPELAQIAAQAAAWRGADTERGFSMALGRFGDPADGDCVAVTAYDESGALRSVLYFVPWGSDGLSLDLMRRDRSADPGLNEFLIVATLRAGPEMGVRRISLNFAVFRSALERGERLGAGFVLRGWRGLLLFVSRWFQIESLYRFNAKFRPVWEPRFVCYPSARDLPRIAIAALEAEAFIVWPRPSLRRLRRFARLRQA